MEHLGRGFLQLGQLVSWMRGGERGREGEKILNSTTHVTHDNVFKIVCYQLL
jgi:hypothetical protein